MTCLSHRVPILLSLAAFLALLGGCVPPVDHPSLAPRPIENVVRAMPGDETAAAGAADPALVAQAAALADEARASLPAIERRIGEARAAVARAGGAAAGSEAWVEAEQALSRAEAERGPFAARLADLDRLRVAQAGVALPALDAALADLAAEDARQRAELTGLAGRLSAP